MIILSQTAYAQLITVLVIFVVVLAVTAVVTKWLANYQKSQNSGRNIEVIETTHIANNKWMQIVRVGNTYKILAISKDSVTFLGDIDPSELKEIKPDGSKSAFKSMFEKALKKDKNSSDDSKDV
ncbi:MAG: flagellar biosynthetic protein FliO [Lachnospiraceae bacterium]|jgi:flagellar protein FliO/FliZ|nr:flagellar biosynthetic protein FliO [Lachnospiraceae bacterium]MBR1651496.1 flagellar biosynthetic protein FliO [Lachnospiraceae bacterium]